MTEIHFPCLSRKQTIFFHYKLHTRNTLRKVRPTSALIHSAAEKKSSYNNCESRRSRFVLSQLWNPNLAFSHLFNNFACKPWHNSLSFRATCNQTYGNRLFIVQYRFIKIYVVEFTYFLKLIMYTRLYSCNIYILNILQVVFSIFLLNFACIYAGHRSNYRHAGT